MLLKAFVGVWAWRISSFVSGVVTAWLKNYPADTYSYWCQRLYLNESSRTEYQTAEEIRAEQRCCIRAISWISWITVQLASWFQHWTLSALSCGRARTERLTKLNCLMEKGYWQIVLSRLLLWYRGLFQWKWNRRKKEEEWRHTYACVLSWLLWCLICVVLNDFTFTFTLYIIYVWWWDDVSVAWSSPECGHISKSLTSGIIP